MYLTLAPDLPQALAAFRAHISTIYAMSVLQKSFCSAYRGRSWARRRGRREGCPNVSRACPTLPKPSESSFALLWTGMTLGDHRFFCSITQVITQTTKAHEQSLVAGHLYFTRKRHKWTNDCLF